VVQLAVFDEDVVAAGADALAPVVGRADVDDVDVVRGAADAQTVADELLCGEVVD
jgi:hypothetical protein